MSLSAWISVRHLHSVMVQEDSVGIVLVATFVTT
jgi:hypothetical protein